MQPYHVRCSCKSVQDQKLQPARATGLVRLLVAVALLSDLHARVNFSDWILEQEKGCCNIQPPKKTYFLARHQIQKSFMRKHAVPNCPDTWYWARKKSWEVWNVCQKHRSPHGLAFISQPARFAYRCQSCVKITSVLEYIHLFHSWLHWRVETKPQNI